MENRIAMTLKVLVSADESGTFKEVVCPLGTDTSKKEGIKPESVQKYSDEPVPNYRTRIIDMIIFEEYLVALRINGDVSFFDKNSYEPVGYRSIHKDTPVSLVGLPGKSGFLVAYESGKVFAVSGEGKEDQVKEIELPLKEGKTIATFVANPFKDGEFAFGGEEQDICLVSLYEKAHKQFNKTKFSPKIVFEAQNVENYFLDLRVPISVKKVRFILEKRFISVTKYGQLRIYDTDKQKRPVQDSKIGAKPIIQAAVSNDHVVLSDTTNLIGMYSLTKIDKNATKIHSASAGDMFRGSVKMVAKFNGGNTGATRAIDVYKNKYVATGGLDRYLRVFDLETKQMVAKVYLGTQVLSILMISDVDEHESNKHERESDSDSDDVWDQLEAKRPVLKKKARKI